MAALVQCGHLRISISTSNASPTLARQLREDLEEILIKSKNSGELIEFLEKLGELRLLAKKSIKKVKENLIWAFGYNIIALPIAAGILLPKFNLLLSPPIAALLMALSSICVVVNALSLKL